MDNWNCYLCFIEVGSNEEVYIRGRVVKIEPGVYVYVGSSRKPGLALARILRHLLKVKKIHWHIDQLTTSMYSRILGAILIRSSIDDCEKQLTSLLVASGFPYVKGFGSSDKRGEPSHLFKCPYPGDRCIENLYLMLERLDQVDDIVYLDMEE